MYKRILAPIDRSPNSNRGLAEAVALAADQRAELMLIHVIDALVWTADLTGMENVSELPEFLRKNREELLAEAKKASRNREWMRKPFCARRSVAASLK
jgi:nucleotide-binding universal stress UspA family protein